MRCKHRHATMVQAMYRPAGDAGWHVTWQCDDCGFPLIDRPVTFEDIERGHELPWLDVDLLVAGMDRTVQADLGIDPIATLVKVKGK